MSTLRIGLLGTIGTHEAELEPLIQFLLVTMGAKHVVYLGGDSAIVQYLQRTTLALAGAAGENIWQRSLDWLDASADALEAALLSEGQLELLERLESLPVHATRRLPLGRGQSAVLCFDRAEVTNELQSRAAVVAFGKDPLPLVKQVGSRFLLCPGSLAKAGVMVLEDDEQGLRVALFDRQCQPIAEHYLTERQRGIEHS
jgi:hypothetical protein